MTRPPESLPARRARLMGPNLPTFYAQPVEIVRGQGVRLWDAAGRCYLDCYNNVPHVGHGHPHVLAAMARQAEALNTHTRYLHRGILDYLDRLLATFEVPLQALVTCTGSEANDLALRLAQAATGQRGIIATDDTYHGNTAAASVLNRREPPGGRPGHVRRVPAPDSVAPLGGSAAAQPQAFAAAVAAAIAGLQAEGHGLAALIVDPAFANEGLPALPPGFLDPAIAEVRRAGGLVIADEVQPGFGRLGSHFWGHQVAGFQPDIVTLGKPMGNGYPVAAALARPAVMAAFRDSFAYFNTFGGNPVAMAAASAVLDVLEREGLQARAATLGAQMLARLQALRHPRIAQARGQGLFLALELARDGAPDGEGAAWLVEAMKARGVLIGRVGRHGQVLKLRPPLAFRAADMEEALAALSAALAELPA